MLQNAGQNGGKTETAQWVNMRGEMGREQGMGLRWGTHGLEKKYPSNILDLRGVK